MEKYGKDYIDMITVTDHDPEIVHALGNAVDLGPRNCCNCIRCKDIAQGISNKSRSFVEVESWWSNEFNFTNARIG